MENLTSTTLIFFVNGKKILEKSPDPECTLISYLRNKLGLCGTKESCGEGGCGSCTVMLSKIDRKNLKIRNNAINSCLTPVVSLHGCAILTVEGIGNLREGLHPVQERIAKSHGTQCGFCTPGFVMSMYTLLHNNDKPNENELERQFQGNLCRCTGYRPILEGFKTFCSPYTCKTSTNCCINNSDSNNLNNRACDSQNCCTKISGSCVTEVPDIEGISTTLYDASEFKSYNPLLDPSFPLELMTDARLDEEELIFQNERVKWFRPTTVESALKLKTKYLDSVFLAGNTALGVDAKYKGKIHPVYIQINCIPELIGIEKLNDEIVVGSGTTFAQLSVFFKIQALEGAGGPGNLLNVMNEMLESFAGPQIRAMATIGGNIVCANPSSHLNPILMATGATVLIQGPEMSRTLQLDSDFFGKENRQILRTDEILKSVTIPLTKKNEFIWFAKQARRKVNDLAIVNCCMKIQYDEKILKITEAVLAYAGMGPSTAIAKQASASLIGKNISELSSEEASKFLLEDFSKSLAAVEGMTKYRLNLASSFLLKFILTLKKDLVQHKLSKREISALNSLRPLSHFPKPSQLFEIRPNDQPIEDLVGRPFAHTSALKHATGEAVYVNDMPFSSTELVGSFVYSEKAHAKLVSINASEALALDGVVAFFDAKSLPPEKNIFGLTALDEVVYATNEVTCVGQIVGFIVARDQLTAARAVRLVKVNYGEILTPILTIDEAIKAESYSGKFSFSHGDVESGFKSSKHVIKGVMRIGGQEHFYMETQSCRVVPNEENELEVFISTQSLKDVQLTLARVLGIPANRIIAKVKRQGGSFGGKETRCFMVAISTALAAHRLRVPVRCVLNRQEDMATTGGRHPFQIHFKVGFNEIGRILAIQEKVYLNGGNSLDHSSNVMVEAISQADTAYNIPNWKIDGFVCKTNLPSNTAFRGFGVPQIMMTTETIMSKVAEHLGNCSAEKIREMHLYKEGDKTPFGKALEYCTIWRCWEECLLKSNYKTRKLEVENFNLENKWRKRGIAVTPTRHNIGLHYKPANQAGALVMIYLDGSVTVHHGGVEMGQGLHTKMIQIASRVLKIKSDKIHITETGTDRVPNATSTAASMSSDLYGMAVLNACEKLMKRLNPYVNANPDGVWEDWVLAAYRERNNLSATGFYGTMDSSYNFETKQGSWPNYLTFGAACSEIELDCLTGDHTVLRTDIIMDVGESLNPAIDIGQIEGGFMQGYGLFVLEEHIYSAEGHLLTKGPGKYKIPSIVDIPREFNVSLLRGAPNPKAVFSSKGIGEPPLFLAASIFFAIKEAVRAARIENSLSPIFHLDSPATVEKVRLACGDNLILNIVSQSGTKM